MIHLKQKQQNIYIQRERFDFINNYQSSPEKQNRIYIYPIDIQDKQNRIYVYILFYFSGNRIFPEKYSKTYNSYITYKRGYFNGSCCTKFMRERRCTSISDMLIVYKEASLSGAMYTQMLPTLDTAHFHIIPFSFHYSNSER